MRNRKCRKKERKPFYQNFKMSEENLENLAFYICPFFRDY